MAYRRLDDPVRVPDLDLMLSVLCEVRHLGECAGEFTAFAAVAALRHFGVSATSVSTFMVLLNDEARHLMAGGVSMQQLLGVR